MKDRLLQTVSQEAPGAESGEESREDAPSAETADSPEADQASAPTAAGHAGGQAQERVFAPRGEAKPHLPAAEPADQEVKWADVIREFHVSGQGPGMPDDPPAGEPLWPAALEALEAEDEAHYSFPYLLPPPSGDEEALPRPLREVVTEAIEASRQEGNDTSLLEAHVDKLLHWADGITSAGLRKQAARADEGEASQPPEVGAAEASTTPSAPVAAVLESALERFVASFAESSQAARDELSHEVDGLRTHLPREGALVAFHPQAPLVLYAWSLARGRRQAALNLTREVRRLAADLEGRLESDAQLQGGDAGHLSQSMGEQGDALVDAAALSSLLPGKRGSKPLDEQRRKRMQKALDALKVHLQASLNEPPFYILHRGAAPLLPGLQADALQRHEEPLESALNFFDDLVKRRVRVLRAMRIAALEIEGRYRPELHDAVFARFQWQSCSEDELRALPPVVVLESAQRLSGRAMSALSQVLGSSRPLHVLALNNDPLTRLSGGGLDLSTGYLPDLGYLAMAHREAFVLQGTLVRPGHLLEGLNKLCESLEPALALVWVPEDIQASSGPSSAAGDGSPSGPSSSPSPSHDWTWRLGWSAHAGRAAACFTYSPANGLSWAQRFDLQGNPQSEALCPTYRLSYEDAGGQEQALEAAVTFAHAAALNPNYRAHFRIIPREAWDESIETSGGDSATSSQGGAEAAKKSRLGRPTQMDIARYIDEFDQTPPAAIPFLWVLDENNTLQRAVMTREMAAACRDRKRSWRLLQELAGVNNEYVRRAEEKLRRELEERLKSEQDVLLEEARKQGAADAIDRLVGILTGVELAPGGDLAAPSLAGETPARAPVEPESDTGTVPGDAPAQSDGAGQAPTGQEGTSNGEAATPGGGPAAAAEEPYIDTILCTTCNDCIQLNPLLFRYNSDKQAEIADPSAGTFAQLVQAAESCPAHCIHPGTPRPDDETATSEMVARAQALES
ncbi:MAG TPA: ferredoxin [Acidobacteriota bacterium]|nr:ferredoxin [Acidobacteriota bacterium]